MANVDTLTEEWVKKLHFENRVDSNLQKSTPGESMKVEIGDITPERLGLTHAADPVSQLDKKEQHTSTQDDRSNSIPANDTYLSSILSAQTKPTKTAHDTSGSCQLTSDCVCYKCQRQRRRAGTRGRTIPTEPSLATLNTSSLSLDRPQEQTSQKSQQQHQRPQSQELKSPPPPPLPPRHIFKPQDKELLATEHSTVSLFEKQQQQPIPPPHLEQVNGRGSFIQRKRPSNIGYDRHLPLPSYSELDSIYRGQQQPQEKIEHQQQQQLDKTRESGKTEQQDPQLQYRDSYEISWQDETGDDILPSLRTFQTIFEETPNESKGLSDVLENKAKELKAQKMQEKEQIDWMNQQQQLETNPLPRRNDCLTLSYRDGPQHTQLTLYHTMKLKGSKDRMAAYDYALQHCVRADSGLCLWIKNQSRQPSFNMAAPSYRPNFTLKKSTYRSILHLAGRKQKSALEELKLKTNKLVNATTSSNNNSNNIVSPLDVLSATPTTMDCTSHSATPNNLATSNILASKTSCDYVDTANQSLPRIRTSVDSEGLTSPNVEQGRSMKTGKMWGSLGRKASKTLCTPSINSVEKNFDPPAPIKETPEPFEKSLDDLCKIMSHVDRSVLKTYLEEAKGDYMKTLSVIRNDVTSGKL